MRTISITADIISLILSVIIIYGTAFEMKHKSRQKTVFTCFAVLTGFAVLSDLITWLVEGNSALLPVNYFFTVITFVAPYLNITVFAQYLRLFVEGKGIGHERLNRRYFRVVYLYDTVAALLVLLACLSGKLFAIGEGGYTDGPYYLAYLDSMGFGFLLVILFIACYAKKLGLHDTLAMTSYLFFPLVGIVINVFHPNISISLPLSALSGVLLYIMLQSDQERKGLETTIRLNRMVRTDELTGLMSRRVYIDTLEHLKPDSPVGVLFCDVNGLKYTNDNKGHEAGDALLREMAAVLQRYFRQNESFRISGDEFVVISERLSEVQFYSQCRKLHEALEAHEYPLASMGSAYGVGGSGKALVEQAENNMRAAKEQFHQAYPLYKRG